MKGSTRLPRVVIDTNQLLSALIFAQGRLTPLRQAWQENRMRPLVSRDTAAELIRVLGYPKFKLTAEEQQELLADYLPNCLTVRIPRLPPATPTCRDAFNLPFVQLAAAGKAAALVTGDHDLLCLAGSRTSFACPILTAEQFLSTLNP